MKRRRHLFRKSIADLIECFSCQSCADCSIVVRPRFSRLAEPIEPGAAELGFLDRMAVAAEIEEILNNALPRPEGAPHA